MNYEAELASIGLDSWQSLQGDQMITKKTNSKRVRQLLLFFVAGHRRTELLQTIFKKGVDLHEQDTVGDELGTSSLLAAAGNTFYSLENVHFLLANGVDIDSQDRFGRTALMKAVQAYKFKTAEFLCNAGSNIEIFDKGGRPALGYLNTDNDKLAEMLITKKTLTGKSSFTCGMPVKSHFEEMNCKKVLALI